MRLAPQETARFYRIWFALLSYINEQLHLVPDLPADPVEQGLSPETAMRVRDALWVNDAVREQFIADNPAGLSDADLALVASWQHRLIGSFYLFRSLQRYTIFLSDTAPAHAYGVLGLIDPIEEVIPLPFPVLTKAVLLPFEHRIVYDGLLTRIMCCLGQDTAATYRNTIATFKSAKG